MVERIFIKSVEGFKKVDLKSFSDEKDLEKMIIRNPKLLAIEEISDELEMYPIASQMETEHGPLDILGVDQYGEIYIIETKMYHNKDRRKIMAQIFDYAGGLSSFRNDFEIFKEKIKQANLNPVNKDTHLKSKTLEDLLESLSSDEDDIVSKVRKNFEKCNFSYILVLDEINQHMKDNIKFFNEKDDNRMYIVTISKFIPEGSKKEIIISSIFGTESAKPTKRNEQYYKWLNEGEEVFYKNLDSNEDVSDTEKNTVKLFISELKKLLGEEPNSSSTDIGYYDWGGGSESPRFFAKFYQIGHSNWNSPAAFNIDGDGSLRFRYRIPKSESAKKFAVQFTEELKNISCAKNLLQQFDEGRNKPLWKVSEWAPCMNELMEVIHKVCKPVES